MARNSYQNLNGLWKYAITESEQFPEKYDGTILVPFSPEAPLSRVNRILQPEFGGCSYHIPGRSYNEEEYGYGKCHSREELTDAIEKLWHRDLFRSIPRGLSASVYTQVSDIEDETNGLMTYDREEIKVDPERIRRLNEKLYSLNEKHALG